MLDFLSPFGSEGHDLRKLPHLRALLCFEAIADFQSFSQAAQALNLTHGAISHQVRSLEDWLQVSLFDRHSGGVTLTAEGQRLKEVCTHSFQTLEQECMNIQSSEAENEITIGCSPSFLVHWLLPCLEKFTHEFDVSKTKLRFDTKANWSRLRRGKVEFLIAGDTQENWDGMEKHLLANDLIGPVCKPGYPSANSDAGKILQSSLLHAKSRLGAWQEWAHASNLGTAPTDGQVFETLSLSIEAARAGLGYAIAPKIVVRQEIQSGKLIAPLGFIPAQHATYLFCRSEKLLSPVTQKVKDWLLRQAQEV